jgi:hypothetical protein
MRDEPEDGLPPEEATLRDRLGAFARSAAAILSTRGELFVAELSAKGPPLWRGLALLAAATAFLFASILMLTALLAVLLAELTGSLTLGITIVLVLYFALTVGGAVFAFRSLSRVEPFHFPVTSSEIRRDLEAAFPAAPESVSAPPFEGPSPERLEPDGELEDRFRRGSE